MPVSVGFRGLNGNVARDFLIHVNFHGVIQELNVLGASKNAGTLKVRNPGKAENGMFSILKFFKWDALYCAWDFPLLLFAHCLAIYLKGVLYEKAYSVG